MHVTSFGGPLLRSFRQVGFFKWMTLPASANINALNFHLLKCVANRSNGPSVIQTSSHTHCGPDLGDTLKVYPRYQSRSSGTRGQVIVKDLYTRVYAHFTVLRFLLHKANREPHLVLKVLESSLK